MMDRDPEAVADAPDTDGVDTTERCAQLSACGDVRVRRGKPSRPRGLDPFATFTEWAGPADDDAYAYL